MEQIIQRIYQAGAVTGHSGKIHELNSAIDAKEGEFLFDIIEKDPQVLRTLEVGCAYGLSSLHICLATKKRPGASHTIVDPFQNIHWDGVGTKHLEEAGIDFFQLVEVKSEFALPRVLETNEGQFNFIFVAGWHTFDHTLLDCFYATRLLRVGGYLAIDDVNFPSVKRVVSFLKNYPCYEEDGSMGDDIWPQTLWGRLKRFAKKSMSSEYRDPQLIRMVALKKVAEDTRSWDWHVDF
jgi:predicted O-methyltransferase YrrM